MKTVYLIQNQHGQYLNKGSWGGTPSFARRFSNAEAAYVVARQIEAHDDSKKCAVVWHSVPTTVSAE